jgi:phosphoglycolate phosphatase-like HAD superfamily hydrolase
LAFFEDASLKSGLPNTRHDISLNINDLRNYFLDESVPEHLRNNVVIAPIDDCGALCLTQDQFSAMIEVASAIDSRKSGNKLLGYIQDRTTEYYSPRRGKCYSLRGASYYRLFLIGKSQKDLLKSLAFRDLAVDLEIYKLIVEEKPCIYLLYTVLDHIKHRLFQIYYGLTKTIIDGRENDLLSKLNLLSDVIFAIWVDFMNLILTENHVNQFKPDLDWLFPLEKIISSDGFAKVRELDSSKTLVWYADRVFQSQIKYDLFVGLLYGGCEIPFAIKAYHEVMDYPLEAEVVPMIYSLNRILKGELLLSSELWTQSNFSELSKICPEGYLPTLQKSSKALVCDNNITTGYSIQSVARYLRNSNIIVDLAIPEVHLDEIGSIVSGVTEKDVYISATQIKHRPIGEYVTCFGLTDRSRVVDRVKFLLGKGDYLQMSGYDFDDTIAKTGSLHRRAWNFALTELIGEEMDVKNFTNNSGKTFEEAAESLYLQLSEKTKLSKEEFVKQLCDKKLQFMLDANYSKIPLIARTVNIVTEKSLRDQQIIVTNNKLAFVKDFLVKRNLLSCFSHLICQDRAFNVSTEEEIIICGDPKPSDAGYLEASQYFKLPAIVKYYGDNLHYDGKFASNLGAEFVHITN